MPIQLNKILDDISAEKALYPNNHSASKQDIEDAWIRVSKNNMLSVHETRSIFKVLQKKYEQEKQKGVSSWKLYDIMDEMHKVQIKEEPDPLEEDEEFEMLEVQEEEECTGNLPSSSAHNSASDADSSAKSSNNSGNELTEKNERTSISLKTSGIKIQNAIQGEEKKLLNTLVNAGTRAAVHANVASQQHKVGTVLKPSLLQHKGITLKKATPNARPPMVTINATEKKDKTTIQLPEAIKRKLNENMNNQPVKKINMTVKRCSSPTAQNTTTQTTVATIKAATNEEEYVPGTVITIPPNGIVGNANTTTSGAASANGYSPRLEEIDFSKDIIFDAGVNAENAQKSGNLINFGNFDNSLPPTFFRNLCNSTRHEALGLYVANIMNRLTKSSANKLELQILRSVADVLTDELDA